MDLFVVVLVCMKNRRRLSGTDQIKLSTPVVIHVAFPSLFLIFVQVFSMEGSPLKLSHSNSSNSLSNLALLRECLLITICMYGLSVDLSPLIFLSFKIKYSCNGAKYSLSGMTGGGARSLSYLMKDSSSDFGISRQSCL